MRSYTDFAYQEQSAKKLMKGQPFSGNNFLHEMMSIAPST